MAGTMWNFGEADDEAYDEADDEAYDEADDEAYDEALANRIRSSGFRGRRYSSGSGTKGGSMRLPGGQNTQVKFSKPLVSKEEFDKTLGMVQRDIGKNNAAIASLDKRFSSSLKSLKGQVEQGSMMPLLLSFMQPQLASVTFSKDEKEADATLKAGVSLPVSTTTQKDSMMPLMLMMMMGSGGSGFMGKSGGQDNMMMLMMIMAMSGKL